MQRKISTLTLLTMLASMTSMASASMAAGTDAVAATETAAAVQPGTQLPEVEGEIRKVDAAAGKLTIRHGPIPNLDMSAMTMIFRVKDPAMLQVQSGDKVRFTVDRVDGLLTVTSLSVEK